VPTTARPSTSSTSFRSARSRLLCKSCTWTCGPDLSEPGPPLTDSRRRSGLNRPRSRVPFGRSLSCPLHAVDEIRTCPGLVPSVYPSNPSSARPGNFELLAGIETQRPHQYQCCAPNAAELISPPTDRSTCYTSGWRSGSLLDDGRSAPPPHDRRLTRLNTAAMMTLTRGPREGPGTPGEDGSTRSTPKPR